MVKCFARMVKKPRRGFGARKPVRSNYSAHQIAITPETHWIPKYFRERIGLTAEGLATPALVSRLLEYRTFPKLGIDRRDLEDLLGSGEPVRYARFVRGVFDLYGKAHGKELVGDKTPEYGLSIAMLP